MQESPPAQALEEGRALLRGRTHHGVFGQHALDESSDPPWDVGPFFGDFGRGRGAVLDQHLLR